MNIEDCNFELFSLTASESRLKPYSMYISFLKPVLDRFLATGILFVVWPILVIISILVFLNMGSPIFFKQKRVGLNNHLFHIIKFRTMRNVDSKNSNLSSAARITKFGRFLRKSSFDELPQLFNILVGNLSFVGPRPLLPEYLELYNEDQKRRHLVKPGLTGWAQINGRSSISWADKFSFDIYYVDNRSAALDAKILVKTVAVVLSGSDATASTTEIKERFNGKN